MKRRLRSLACTLAVLASIAGATPSSANAQQVRHIETDGAWLSFQFLENGHPVCYIASRPTKILPADVRHGDVFLLVTDRPADRSREVPSLMVGYTFKANSEVRAEVDKSRFRLFTDGNAAWTNGPSSDRALTAAMRAGDTIRFQATSARGTHTSYVFSLSGVTAALRRISSACEA
ncbi:invasion associated locus B family protein [Inquilinus sp. NPDC058860]|uniref:invasion associated locus B family protein n=1 Tax=Inquilinus sp. NPDC058860 TaxID=3346652 RepID=UPI003697BA81